MNHASFWGGAAAPYEIEQSLRFNSDDSAYLTRTVSTNGNRRTFTISFWYKKGKNSRRHAFYGAGDTAVAPGGGFWFRLDTQERLVAQAGGGGTTVGSADLFRDHSAWYHFVCAVDTTQATTTDRIKLYVNGRQISDFDTSFILYPAQNFEYDVNSTNASQQIGRANDSNTFLYYVDGYVAEYHLLDGTQATASDFGEPDNNGVWRPIAYSGTYGTNGFYLKFDPSATNGIGHDHSGNGNHFTPSGFTTSGTGTDVMSDTPTTNWATLNPLDKHGSLTLTNGNLDVETSSGYYDVASTFHIESGKYYWEATQTSVSGDNEGLFGITRSNNNCQNHSSVDSFRIVYFGPAGAVYVDGTGLSNVTGLATYGVGDTVGAALSIEDGTISFYKNGTLQTTITSASVVGGNVWKPYVGMYQAGWTVNFGQRAFAYTPPTGYKALNTANLPEPDIKDGSDYFDTVLYTGNGSTQSITVGFQPDLVWGKDRSDAISHNLFDSVRGGDKQLSSDLTNAEVARAGDAVTFTSTGITLDATYCNINNSTDAIVAWNWLAGNGTSSNTDGSITSTVSANPTAGFSIVSYTGNGTNGATIGHGLGVAPKMVIWKNRDDGGTSDNWLVYNENIGLANNLYLNNTNGITAASIFWDTAPSSTVFTMKNENKLNANGDDYIAYFFAEVEGYSKFGRYAGNSSTDGPFVYCGFKPAFLVCKVYDRSSYGWEMMDSARDTYNDVEKVLAANASDSEGTGTRVDFLSNGFKLRTDANVVNQSGYNYIFMAFASSPFGGSGVSPATAR